MNSLTDIAIVRQQLLEAGKADQSIRQTRDFAAWKATDTANQGLLKQIIAAHGWPTISLVGEAAENAAFRIAQHASHDLPLMEQVLSLRNALPENETHRSDTALLEDRVLMLQQRPQKYGSQIVTPPDSIQKIHPIDGINTAKLLAGDRLQMELLNARRKTVGLNEPYDKYLAHFGIGVRELTGKHIGK